MRYFINNHQPDSPVRVYYDPDGKNYEVEIKKMDKKMGYINVLDLLEEHERWAKTFGGILISAFQGDFEPVKCAARNMELDYIDGSPVLYSPAIQKAKGEL
uniref:Uncharacterized protein n=1 Tax=viral metagenome TaxID=1070528 RepID=A0A6H2A474_9ZZZZ